jgi:hypothetical protein
MFFEARIAAGSNPWLISQITSEGDESTTRMRSRRLGIEGISWRGLTYILLGHSG